MLLAIDNFLNSITMYKLVFINLMIISGVGVAFSAIGWLSFSPMAMMGSVLILLTTCYGVNFLIARLLKIPTNVGSAIITALILHVILSPSLVFEDMKLAVLTAAIAMLSKYVFAIKKKHLFNPAAIALVIIGLLGSPNVIWWAGSRTLLPVVAICGFLIVRKIRRVELFATFLVTSILTILLTRLGGQTSPVDILMASFTSWPLIFFATVMLTEPLTTPPTKRLQIIYGGLVGFLFGIQFHFGRLYSTPELALVAGNVFSYLVSSKQRLTLFLSSQRQLATDMYEFTFKPDQTLAFQPGQYLEWTLGHTGIDGRGNRRYFTVASSPTETEIKLGVKISEKASSFKKALKQLNVGDKLMAGQLAGDFTLPKDPNQKLVFLAGGIGITPFRSMVKYLADSNQKRDIVLLYAAPNTNSFAYQDIFDDAQRTIGLKPVYVITHRDEVPPGWKGQTGHVSAEMISKEVPDYAQRTFYLSGPNAMVMAYENMLKKLGIPKSQIVTDYFPGF